MTRTVTMTIRIDESVKARLAKAAEADRRNLNNLVNKILADWIEQQKGRPK